MGWKTFKMYARASYGVKISEREAKVFRSKFFKAYSALGAWHTRQKKLVNAFGEVRNMIGRLRRLPDIRSNDGALSSMAERQSINSPVQSLASDITLLGLAEICGTATRKRQKYDISTYRIQVYGTVHDSILLAVHQDDVVGFLPKLKAIMENPKTLEKVFNFKPSVPVVVDVSVSRKAWGKAIEINFDGKWRKQIRSIINEKN